MKIHFKSIYGTEDNKNTVEFYAKLERSKFEDFNVLEFSEKNDSNKNIKTRIEYNDQKVIIYNGPSTLELEKDKIIKNLFKVNNNQSLDVFIYTFLEEIINKENSVIFIYKISVDKLLENSNKFELNLSFLPD